MEGQKWNLFLRWSRKPILFVSFSHFHIFYLVISIQKKTFGTKFQRKNLFKVTLKLVSLDSRWRAFTKQKELRMKWRLFAQKANETLNSLFLFLRAARAWLSFLTVCTKIQKLQSFQKIVDSPPDIEKWGLRGRETQECNWPLNATRWNMMSCVQTDTAL